MFWVYFFCTSIATFLFFFGLYFISAAFAGEPSKHQSDVSHHSRYWLLAEENKTCSITTSGREKEPEPLLLIHRSSPLPHALLVLHSSKWLSLSPSHAACPSLRFHFKLIRYGAAQRTVLPGALWSCSDWAVTFSCSDALLQCWQIRNKGK